MMHAGSHVHAMICAEGDTAEVLLSTMLIGINCLEAQSCTVSVAGLFLRLVLTGSDSY